MNITINPVSTANNYNSYPKSKNVSMKWGISSSTEYLENACKSVLNQYSISELKTISIASLESYMRDIQKVLDGYCNIKGSSWFAPTALRDRADVVNDIYEKRLREQCSPIVNKYYNSTLEYFSSDEIKKYLDELEEQGKRYKYTPSLWKKICEVKSIYEEKLKIESRNNSW